MKINLSMFILLLSIYSFGENKYPANISLIKESYSGNVQIENGNLKVCFTQLPNKNILNTPQEFRNEIIFGNTSYELKDSDKDCYIIPKNELSKAIISDFPLNEIIKLKINDNPIKIDWDYEDNIIFKEFTKSLESLNKQKSNTDVISNIDTILNRTKELKSIIQSIEDEINNNFLKMKDDLYNLTPEGLLESEKNKKLEKELIFNRINEKLNNLLSETYKMSKDINKIKGKDKEYNPINLDEEKLAQHLAPKINYLNMNTYVGFGGYYAFNKEMNNSDSISWNNVQPFVLSFETRTDELRKWQSVMNIKLQLYATQGGQFEIGYGQRKFLPTSGDYFSIKGFIQAGYIDNDNSVISYYKIDSIRKKDYLLVPESNFQIKSYFEGEFGGSINYYWHLSEKNNYLGGILKFSSSIPNLYRTYNISSENTSFTRSPYYLGIEGNLIYQYKVFQFCLGLKSYIFPNNPDIIFRDKESSSQKDNSISNQYSSKDQNGTINLTLNRFNNTKIFFQILFRLNPN